MPVCLGCGASYNNTVEFCPYCGKAQPEPQVLNVNVHHLPSGYEEAVLKIVHIRDEELNESPFDWRPNLFGKVLDSTKEKWTRISYFRFVLVSLHPQKGEYVAFESDLFRAFLKDTKFPSRILNTLTFQPVGQQWVEVFFSERKKAWQQFNEFLIQQNWVGLTEEAIRREPPFELQMPAEWEVNKQTFWLEDCLRIPIYRSLEYIADRYRYQRQVG